MFCSFTDLFHCREEDDHQDDDLQVMQSKKSWFFPPFFFRTSSNFSVKVARKGCPWSVSLTSTLFFFSNNLWPTSSCSLSYVWPEERKKVCERRLQTWEGDSQVKDVSETLFSVDQFSFYFVDYSVHFVIFYMLWWRKEERRSPRRGSQPKQDRHTFVLFMCVGFNETWRAEKIVFESCFFLVVPPTPLCPSLL